MSILNISGKMELESRRDKRISHLVGISLVISFILPHSHTVFLLVNPLLCILLWGIMRNKQVMSVSWIVIATLFISLLSNISLTPSMKSVISCLTIMLYCFCFPFVDAQIKIRPVYFYVTIAVIFLTQIAYILNITFITNFLDTYYPIEGDLEHLYSSMRSNITVENMLNYRLGGLYRNPNQCARALTLLMAAFLVLFNGQKKTIWFAAIAFVGVVMTGSRTGFVVSGLILIAYALYGIRRSSPMKMALLFAAVGVVTYLLVEGSGIFRAVEISAGMGNSSNLKFEAFRYYVQNEQSVFHLLFGYFDPEKFKSGNDLIEQFDADYGYLIFNYGFVGFMAILIFCLGLFQKTNKQGRIFFIVLLWMLSSTIFSSYRAVFMYFLLLSLVYKRFPKQKSSVTRRD